MRIRIGFNADLDPAFYLNADPDTDPDLGAKPKRIWIRILVRLLSHKKLKFYMKNILEVDNRSRNIHAKVQKPF